MRVLLFTVMVMATSACSDIPSVADGRKALEEKVKKDSDGLIRLGEFKKTNAVERELLGKRLYQMEYSAKIEFTQDLMWSGPGPFGWNGNFHATPGRPRNTLDSFHPSFIGRTAVKKGETADVSGTVVLEKAEKGWRAFSGL